jgi:hypothetical protein
VVGHILLRGGDSWKGAPRGLNEVELVTSGIQGAMVVISSCGGMEESEEQRCTMESGTGARRGKRIIPFVNGCGRDKNSLLGAHVGEE